MVTDCIALCCLVQDASKQEYDGLARLEEQYLTVQSCDAGTAWDTLKNRPQQGMNIKPGLHLLLALQQVVLSIWTRKYIDCGSSSSQAIACFSGNSLGVPCRCPSASSTCPCELLGSCSLTLCYKQLLNGADQISSEPLCFAV